MNVARFPQETKLGVDLGQAVVVRFLWRRSIFQRHVLICVRVNFPGFFARYNSRTHTARGTKFRVPQGHDHDPAAVGEEST